DHIQSGMQLETGPLFKAVLIRNTGGQGADHSGGDYLLLVAHHLVIDGVSWRILFEDLSGLYGQYLMGEPLNLPLKTDSFQYWQQAQLSYSKSERLLQEEGYWSEIESVRITPLPVDNPQGSNRVRDTVSHSFLLDAETTNRLLTECYQAYHTDVNDILLTGLGLALSEVFGMEKVLLALEGHGREDIGSEVDVSRTIGWFTTMYPVVLDMGYRGDMIRQLIAIKEGLHRVPNKGIGYGILRYLAGKDYRQSPEILFNYLGDFGSGVRST
ncbi:MAG: condensation domain-containing protein, partial [Chitinophaga rupis]